MWMPTRIKTAATQGRTSVQQSVLTPSVTLNYLLFDFGGRSGRVAGARQRLIAASFTHNAAIQDVVLQIQVGLLPVSRQPRVGRRAADHGRGSPDQPDRRRGAAPGGPRDHRGRAAGTHRGEPGAAQPRDHRREPADGPGRAGAVARFAGQPAVRRRLDRGDRPGGRRGRQRGCHHRPRARGPSGPRRGRGPKPRPRAQISRRALGLLPSLGFTANAGRTYATTLPDGANSYNLGTRAHHPALQRAFTPVRSPRRAVRGRGGGSARRAIAATGRLPGVQRLSRAADRDPPGAHHRGSARQRRRNPTRSPSAGTRPA